MKKPILTLLIFGICLSVYSQKVNRLAVFFQDNNYKISPKSQKEIEIFLQGIDSNSFITLNGVANFIGDYNSNLKLSRNRALAVKNIIVSKGIPENKIEVRFQGERYTRQTPNAIIESRRVDIIVYQKREATSSHLTSQFELNTFDIPYPERNTSIKGPYGTIIEIVGSSFIYKNTKETVSKLITIKLKEFYKKSEFIEYKLSTTTTDDKMLESGGMIYLEAWEGNQKLELAKEITLKFPTNNYKKGMEAFKGVMKNDIVNWKEINEDKQSKADVSIVSNDEYLNDKDHKIYEFVSKYHSYPPLALEKGIQGTVRVVCKIGKNGEILDIQTEGKKFGDGLEEEAMRVIRKMPRTYLKTELSDKDSATITIPVNFAIEGGGYFGDSDSKNLTEKRASFEKMLEIKSDSINVSALSLNYYILSSTNLGWINCDRFYDEPIQNIIVNLPSMSKQFISIVFTKINSVISQFCLSNKVEFLNIGKDLDATILATKKEGNKNLVSITKVNTSSNNISINPYKEMTAEELKKLMQSFDN